MITALTSEVKLGMGRLSTMFTLDTTSKVLVSGTFIQMARDFPRSVLASFEAHFSPSDIGDMLAVEDGKKRF